MQPGYPLLRTCKNNCVFFYIFYATFSAVITFVFLLLIDEAIADVPKYLLSLPAFLSIKLADFIVRGANLIALLTLVARIHFVKFFR